MDLDPGVLLVSFLVSGIGWVAFSYGRRQRRFPQVGVGLALLAFPYFVSSIPLMLLIATALLGLLWGLVKMGL